MAWGKSPVSERGSVFDLRIASDFRRTLKSQLYKYGIHRASLFLDLDGLATHIEWLRIDNFEVEPEPFGAKGRFYFN